MVTKSVTFAEVPGPYVNYKTTLVNVNTFSLLIEVMLLNYIANVIAAVRTQG